MQIQHFISKADLQALRFLPIWEALRPRTPMGEQKKYATRPYQVHEKELWSLEMARLCELLPLQNDQERFLHIVKGMEDPTPALMAWKKGIRPTRVDWFHIQQFLQKGWRVLSQPNWDTLWAWFPAAAKIRWQKLLDILAPSEKARVDSGTFQLEAIFPDLFQPIQSELLTFEKEKLEYLTEKKERVERELGFEIGRRTPFYVSRKEIDKIAKLERHNAFMIVKETPFDIAFDWSSDEIDEQLQKRKERLERSWVEAEEEALTLLAQKAYPFLDDLLHWVDVFGQIDLRYAKACLGHSYGGVVPIWEETAKTIVLKEGFHPWLKEQWQAQGNDFTPVDLEVRNMEVAVIVGPNMGGKSVAMKTLGLCTLMAMLGLLVPAQSFQFAPIDGIVYIGGEQEQLELGLSSFGGEIKQLVSLLQRSREEQLLVLCDEVGRGTNPEEGEALAISIVEELNGTPWYSCFVSHYSALVTLPKIRVYQIIGLPKDFDQLQSIDHRLVQVQNGEVPQTALKIAEWLGLPTEVINRARRVLEKRKKGDLTS